MVNLGWRIERRAAAVRLFERVRLGFRMELVGITTILVMMVALSRL